MIIFRLRQGSSYKKSGLIKATDTTIYKVISDIPGYPKFIPYVDSASILSSKTATQQRAELAISFSSYKKMSFISNVTLIPPSANNVKSSIHAICTDSPLQHLDSFWQITKKQDNLSQVNYRLSFQFNSFIYQWATSSMITYLGQKLWDCFEKQSLLRQSQLKASPSDGQKPASPSQSQNIADLVSFLEKNPTVSKVYAMDNSFKEKVDAIDNQLRGRNDYAANMELEVSKILPKK